MAVRLGEPRLQGGRLQPGVACRQRGVRRGAHVERRGRPEDRVGRRAGHGQRRGLLDRLGRPAAEPAEPAGAGAVLHRQRRRRRAAAASRSSSTRGRRRRRSFAPSADARAFQRRERRRAASMSRTRRCPNTPDYTATFGAELSRALAARLSALRPRRGRLLRRVQVRRRRTAPGRTRTRSPTSGPARAASGCSPRAGCGTRSTRSTSRSRSRTTRSSRRRASSARADGRGRSASPPGSRSGRLMRDSVRLRSSLGDALGATWAYRAPSHPVGNQL